MDAAYSSEAGLRAELVRRKAAAQRARYDVDLQRRVRELCRRDILFWVNCWCWTYDPRIPALLPFVLWEEQEKILLEIQRHIREGRDYLLEKSRDQGATWLGVAAAVHPWIFEPWTSFGFASRNQDLVDKKGDPDCIFEKIRTMIDTQPDWMLPPQYGQEYDNFGRILNPENGATLKGMWGDQIGRGGRSTAILADEYAFIERADVADRAMSQNTKCRIYISTPNGMGNSFYMKRHGGKIDVGRLHWLTDPRKNAWEAYDAEGRVFARGNGEIPEEVTLKANRAIHPWYEAEKERLDGDPVALAQEVDIDYSASIEGVLIKGEWVRAAILLHQRFLFPEYRHKIGSIDVADGGTAVNAWGYRTGPIIRAIETWKGDARRSSDEEHAIGVDTPDTAIDLNIEHGIQVFFYDAPGVGVQVGAALRKRRKLPFAWRGINTGDEPTDARHPDGRTSKERFGNLKAELWWHVRRRFEKTYKFVEEGKEYPMDELISIPNHAELIAQLPITTYYTDDKGKIRVESKKDLAKRGVASPDIAEMLVLLFSPAARLRKAAAGGKRDVAKFKPR